MYLLTTLLTKMYKMFPSSLKDPLDGARFLQGLKGARLEDW
jgi:hypothetical protein